MRQKVKEKDYQESVLKAEFLDYQEVPDPNAFKGISYIKDDKKWIFNIEALAIKLGVRTTEELDALGYNTEDYFKYYDLSFKA